MNIQTKKRVLLNASALYGKIVINALVAFITTRITLQFLGDVDFGLFSLIGGVVALLSFLNGALLQSTQRFLSIAKGLRDNEEIQQVFNSGVMLHIIMSLFLVVIFIFSQPLLFNGFLNIPPNRHDAAINTYYVVIATTTITFFTIPYNAAINAREEMWFFAISDILMSLMKLGGAIAIMKITDDSGTSIVIYALIIMISTLIILVIKIIWCSNRYPECSISLKKLRNKRQILEQFSFTGWNTLVTFAVVSRNQGIAVVLNVFFGPAINAAYGIANQINALVSNFSTSLSSVFAPQIIESHSSDNRDRMLRLAIFSSKITLYVSAIMGFPFLLESDTILNIWLSEVPNHASNFCKLIIISFIVQQFYPGMIRALYAQGEIKWYQISATLALLIPVIVGYFLFSHRNLPPESILFLIIIGQVSTLIITIQFAQKKLELNISHAYTVLVLKPVFVLILTYLLLSTAKSIIDNENIRLITILITGSLLLTLQFYLFVLTEEEKRQFKSIFEKFQKKIR